MVFCGFLCHVDFVHRAGLVSRAASRLLKGRGRCAQLLWLTVIDTCRVIALRSSGQRRRFADCVSGRPTLARVEGIRLNSTGWGREIRCLSPPAITASNVIKRSISEHAVSPFKFDHFMENISGSSSALEACLKSRFEPRRAP